MIFGLLLTATACRAQSETFHIVYSGTSITCGSGASAPEKSFTAIITGKLPNTVSRPVAVINICHGGSISVFQLALLRNELANPRPDLLLVEVGTLDQIYGGGGKLGERAVEAIFQLAVETRIPTVAIYPLTQYAALPRRTVQNLAKLYSLPLADIAEVAARRGFTIAELTIDNVHPNDRGHALIAEAVLEKIPLAGGRATAGRPTMAVRWIRCRANCGTSLNAIRARSLVLLFDSIEGTNSFSFKVDDKHWTDVTNQPGWLVTYPVLLERIVRQHSIEVRANSAPLVGYLVE